MVTNLRADMEDDQFHRFKKVKAEFGASTNDKAVVELIDFYEKHKDDE